MSNMLFDGNQMCDHEIYKLWLFFINIYCGVSTDLDRVIVINNKWRLYCADSFLKYEFYWNKHGGSSVHSAWIYGTEENRLNPFKQDDAVPSELHFAYTFTSKKLNRSIGTNKAFTHPEKSDWRRISLCRTESSSQLLILKLSSRKTGAQTDRNHMICTFLFFSTALPHGCFIDEPEMTGKP